LSIFALGTHGFLGCWLKPWPLHLAFREHFPHYVANGFQVLVVLKHWI